MIKKLMGTGIFIACFWHASPAQIRYQVSFPNPNSHYIQVEAVISGIMPDSFDMKMPVWIPGSYMVREYARHVEGFTARGADGSLLRAPKFKKNGWRIYNGNNREVRIRYRVYAFELSVRTNFVDSDQAYINGPALFMYTDAFLNSPCEVTFIPWDGWKNISSGLPVKGNDQWVRRAENFDQLVDCPVVIGNHTVFSFDYQGIPHHIAMVGEAVYDSARIKNDLYKIVDECTRIFGENPNKDYTFIVHNTQSGGGGLEHMNSTSVMTARTNYQDPKGYRGFLSLIAHEYFHLWIVKRVRPMELGPFDYENEVYTRQLWFFEGFTSFYDDYLVYRSGLMSEADYLETVKGNLSTVLNTPGDKIQSLSESSFDAWIKYYRQNENSRNSLISYYTKGAVVATLLNLDFLNRSNGRVSLDNLVHGLYHDHYKKSGKGITDDELLSMFNKTGGTDYTQFFNEYIHGTGELPAESYLRMAGLNWKRMDGRKQPSGYLGATYSVTGNRAVVVRVDRDGPAWFQGLSVNDEIISANGKPAGELTNMLAESTPGAVVSFSIMRAGLPRNVPITLGEPVAREFEWEDIRKPDENQVRVRKAWLKKNK